MNKQVLNDRWLLFFSARRWASRTDKTDSNLPSNKSAVPISNGQLATITGRYVGYIIIVHSIIYQLSWFDLASYIKEFICMIPRSARENENAPTPSTNFMGTVFMLFLIFELEKY